MSIQISDTIIFNNQRYNIGDVENRKSFFMPDSVGMSCTSISTACYRGYYCEYVVSDVLMLDTLTIKSDIGCYCDLFGNEAEVDIKTGVGRYKNLHYPINYSGGILIYDEKEFEPLDFDEAAEKYFLYFRGSRFVPLITYKNVYELRFKKGKLLSIANFTDKAEELRHTVSKNPALKQGKPSEREALSNSIINSVFEEKYWWLHFKH